VEAAGGATDADGDGDGTEQACADESGGSGAEIKEGVCRLPAVDAVLVSQCDDRVGESRALLWSVDLLGDGGERVPAPVGIVVFDRFAEPSSWAT